MNIRMLALGFMPVLVLGCSHPSADAPADAGGGAGATVAEGGPMGGAEGNGGAAQEPAPTTPVPIDAGVVQLSPDNTTIQFVGKHTNDQPDRIGVFTDFTGKVEIDPASKALKSVTAEFKTESLETAIPNLTTHLKSPDFLDVRTYPTAKFESTSVAAGGGEGTYDLVGNFSLMNETKEVRIPVQLAVTDAGLVLTGNFTIDRTEYGMVGQDGVKKEVDIKVSVGQKSQTPQAGGFGPGGGGGGGRGKFDPAAMFNQRDADGDGKLSGDEISERMRGNLAEIDKDGDGAITREEFQQRMRQFRGGPGGGGPGGGGPGGGAGRPQRPAGDTAPTTDAAPGN